jgi:DegV family protein with EDD domain
LEKIKIITDSTADLPNHLIEKHDIEVLPLIVNFGSESYRDGVDIKLPEFLEKMNNSGSFPSTSQVNPQTFYDCYKGYLEAGYKIVSLHLSSKMSGTYQSACIARDMLETEDIVVIDSQNVTSGLGLLVLKACSLKAKGLSIKEIGKSIIEAIPHVKSALAFESLDNLVKGGRLSKTAGVIGNLLGIRLILGVVDGEMAVLDKVRGSKKAVKTILDYVESHGIQEDEPSILLQVENKEIFEALKESLNSKNTSYYEAEVGCVVGTHSGTGACGLFFIEKY